MAKRSRNSMPCNKDIRQGALFPTPGFLRPVAAVADYLGVRPKAVRRWIKDGDLAALRVGRQFRIHDADLEAYLAKRRF